MAYINQDRKAQIAPVVKAVCKKYGVKATLSIDNHSSLVLSIKSGKIDFIGNANKVCGANHAYVAKGFTPAKDHLQINNYWYHDHFDGEAKKFLAEVLVAMNDGNHDNSDIQSDYFDVGWYVNVNVGRWNKPYVLEA